MEYSIGDLHGDYTKLFIFISHSIINQIDNQKTVLLYNNKIICEYNIQNNNLISYIENFEYNKEKILNLNFEIYLNDKPYNFDNNNNIYILLGDIFDCFIFTNDEEYKIIKQSLSKKIFLFGGPFSYKSYSLKNINSEDLLTDNYYNNIKIKYQTLTYLLVKYLKQKLKKRLKLILGNHEITYYGLYSKDLRNFITENFQLYYKSSLNNYIYTHGVANKSILKIINFQLNNKYFHSITKSNDYFNHIINIKNSITLLDKSTNDFNSLTILDYLINYINKEDVKYKHITLLYNFATNYNILLKLYDELPNLSLNSTFEYLITISKLFTRTTLFNHHTIKLYNKLLTKLLKDKYRIFNDNTLYNKIQLLVKLINNIRNNFYIYINKIYPSNDKINTKTQKIIYQNITSYTINYVYNNINNLILKEEYYNSIKKLYKLLQPNILKKLLLDIKEIINIYENYINFHLYFQSNIISFCKYYNLKNITKTIILQYLNNNEIQNIYPLQICGHKYIEKSKINYKNVKIFCMDKALSTLYSENYNLIQQPYLLYYGILTKDNFKIININNNNNPNKYELFIENYNI